MRKCATAAIEYRRKVCLNHVIPFFVCHIRKQSHVSNSGIVDQNIKTVAGQGDGIEDSFDIVGISDISGHNFTGTIRHLFDLGTYLMKSFP